MGYKDEKDELFSIYESGGGDEAFEKAVTAYEEAIKKEPIDPNDMMLYAALHDFRSQDYQKKAVQFYEKAIKLADEQKNECFYQANRQLIALNARMGLSHNNIERYKKELLEHPDDVEYYTFLAYAYHSAFQNEDAWETIKAGLKIDPNNAVINYYAGDICNCLGEYDRAVDFWKKSLKLDPECVSGLFSIVFLYQELGKQELALQTWREIVKWQDEHGYSHENEWPKKEIAELEKQLGIKE